jgi:hypothetical protein
MSNNDLYNTSLKFLSKSLNKLEQNKPVNLALVNEINNKYLLMSPYNILAQPSYLLATNVNAVEAINAKEVDEIKEIINKIILKIRQRRDKKKGKLQELADAEAAEATAFTALNAAKAALATAQAAAAAPGANDIYIGARTIANEVIRLDAFGGLTKEKINDKLSIIENRLRNIKSGNLSDKAKHKGAKQVYDLVQPIVNNVLLTEKDIVTACTTAADELNVVEIMNRAKAALDTAEAAYKAAQARTTAARLALK